MKTPARVLLAALAALLLLAAPVQAKSYRLPAVDILAVVHPDGSMSVEERRTWAFSGAFSWVEQDVLFPPGTDLVDISGEPGTVEVSKRSGSATARWQFSARDEALTLVLRYRVLNAVLVHNDVAELYWKFVGDDWDVPTERVSVILRLPAGAAKEDVRAWGHPAVRGEVQIKSDDVVRWDVQRLPEFVFLEGRVVFPTALIQRGGRRTGQTALPQILAEEERWAKETNRQIWDKRLALLCIPLGLLLLVAVWRRGRGPKGSFTGPYHRELPADYSPGELSVLWHKRGRPTGQELGATLLDLARRGHVALEPLSRPRGDLEVTFTGKGKDALRPHEELLVQFLRGKEEAERLALSSAWKRPAEEVFEFTGKWKKALDDAGKQHDFWDKNNTRYQLLGCFPILLVGAVGLGVLLFAGLQITGVSLFVATLLGGFANFTIRLRTQEGADQYSQWAAFRRFLTHFSRLDIAEVPALALWDHYLVYATVLGVAKECLAQMKIVLPRLPEEQRRQWESSPIFRGSAGGFDYLERVSSGVQSWQRAMPSPSASSSTASGSGGGGGFSGGGGRGGGGGGGRAG